MERIKQGSNIMRRVKLFIMFLLASSAIVSCGSSEALQLDGTAWELTLLDGIVPIAETTITLVFEEDGIHGNAGCNSYFGSYVLGNDGSIQISDVGSTEMACLDPSGLMDQESSYLGFLSIVVKAVLQGDQLILQNASGQDILVFSPASE